MKKVMIVFAAWFLSGAAFGAAAIEAKKDGVEVFESADKSASVLTKMKKGESLVASERKGMYWQVKTADGKVGFVSVLNVKHKVEGGGLGEAIRGAVKEGRSAGDSDSSRARSAVMGVRGLDDNDSAYAGTVKPNLRAVYAMEDYSVPKAKLEKHGESILKEIEHRSHNK